VNNKVFVYKGIRYKEIYRYTLDMPDWEYKEQDISLCLWKNFEEKLRYQVFYFKVGTTDSIYVGADDSLTFYEFTIARRYICNILQRKVGFSGIR
jgi:hypothetical protein